MSEVAPLSGTISSSVTGDVTDSEETEEEERTILMQCRATLIHFRTVLSGTIRSKGLRRPLITRQGESSRIHCLY